MHCLDRNIFQIIRPVFQTKLDFERRFDLNGRDNLFEIERKTNHLSYNLKIFFVTWIFKKEVSKQAQEQDIKT